MSVERDWLPRTNLPQPTLAADPSAAPLEDGVRRRMERRFGEDFSTVRVHSGREAAASAQAIGARAYAVAEDVAFASGRYAPDTEDGERLLAHELSHVVDHRDGAAPGAYRAPEGETSGPERPVVPPSLRLAPDLGSLSLGLSTLDGFGFTSSALTAEHRREIAAVAEMLSVLMARMPGGRVTVTGHADSVGGERANTKLGLQRAEAARDALVEAGVPVTAIELVSEGESAPVVPSATAEPRNRRVEVRFNGELLRSGIGGGRLLGGAGLRLDPAPPLVDLTPRPAPLTPALFPPFTPGLLPAPAATRDADRESPPARAAGPGDALKALTKIPSVAAWIERVKEERKSELKALPTGEKVILGTAGVSMATLAAVGISSDPAASKFVLNALNGAEIEVPGAPWLKVKAITPGGSVGAGLTLELSHFVKELK